MNVYPLPSGDVELGDYPYRIDENWCNVVWIINEHCNLRCPYCVTGLKRATGSNVTIVDKLGIDKVIANFDKIRQDSGKNLYLTITGGEPTLVNNFVKFCQKLIKNDFVMELQTNLVSNYVMDFINDVGPDGVAQIMASYHGYLLDDKKSFHDKYIENCTRAIEKGHTAVVKIVATPEEINNGLEEKVDGLKLELPDGTPILTWVYIKWMPPSPGNYKGAYPYSYTDDEKEVLDKVTKYRQTTQKMYRDGAGFFKGIKCDAGRGFVVAYSDGIVSRCLPGGRAHIVGDLKKGELKFNQKPEQCLVRYCSTTFWPLWYAKDPWKYMPKNCPYKKEGGYFNRFGPKCEIKRIDE